MLWNEPCNIGIRPYVVEGVGREINARPLSLYLVLGQQLGRKAEPKQGQEIWKAEGGVGRTVGVSADPPPHVLASRAVTVWVAPWCLAPDRLSERERRRSITEQTEQDILRRVMAKTIQTHHVFSTDFTGLKGPSWPERSTNYYNSTQPPIGRFA